MFLLWFIFFITGLFTKNDTLKVLSIVFGVIFIIEELACVVALLTIPQQFNAILNQLITM